MRRLVFTAFSCAATACTYGSGKESYDLSAAAFSVVSAFSDGHTYFVSLCGDLTAAQLPSGACPAGGSVGVQLHRESGTCKAVGGPSSRGEGAAAKGALGVELLFSNGDSCGAAGPRRLRVEVTCSGGGEDSAPEAVEEAPCAYVFRLASRLGCPTQCRAPGGLTVCGGAERGRCVRAPGDGGGARCECVPGATGALCGEGDPAPPSPPPPLPPPLAPPPALRSPAPAAPPPALPRADGGAPAEGAPGAAALGAAAAAGAAATALLRRCGRSRALLCALIAALALLLGAFALAAAPATPLLAPVLARAPPPRGAKAALGGGLCSHAPGLRFAVFQSEPHHTDLFGFLLDFAAVCGHNFSLFVGHPDAAVSAVPVWQRLYGPLEVLHTSALPAQHGRFDAIFFTTPDSPVMSNEWQLQNQGRCVYISHKSNMGFTKPFQMVRLHSSSLSGYPYVVTSFSGEAIVPAALRERVVVYVGSIYDGENARLAEISALAAALAPAGFALQIYCNTIQGDADAFFKATPTAKWVKGAPTEDLYAAVRRASFFLILPSLGSVYLKDRGTNSVALAFSMATPIITHQTFAGLYDLSREGTGTLIPGLLPDFTAALAELTPHAYELLVHAAAAHRAQLLLHNIKSLEYALDALPELSSGGGLLPLPAGIARRIPYRHDER